MNRPPSALKIGLLTLLGVTFFTLIGLKNFEAWSQVLDLWASDEPLFLLAGHPHFFRYLLMYPGLSWEHHAPGLGFSTYVAMFVAFNAVLWQKLSYLCMRCTPPVGAWVIFIAIHFFMNGRGVMAWSAWLLCSCVCLHMQRGELGSWARLWRMTGACLLATVSTGVFVLVAITLLYFYATRANKNRRRSGLKKTVLFGLVTPVLIIIFDYFLVAIDKNLEFYGGGFEGAFNMLNHGLGVIFAGSFIGTMLLIALAPPALMAMAFFAIYGKDLLPLKKLILFAVGGGLFGFTVLTLIIPLLILQLSMRKNRRHIGRQRTTPGLTAYPCALPTV
jgi:hypothetical protein